MKKTLLAISASLLLANSAFAGTDSCQIKINRIEAKLADAKQHGHPNKVRSLERALSKVQTYCTDDGQRNKAQSKLQDKKEDVLDKLEDLDEARADLKEARQKGDQRKILKQERKVKEKLQELDEVKAELKQAENDHRKLRN